MNPEHSRDKSPQAQAVDERVEIARANEVRLEACRRLCLHEHGTSYVLSARGAGDGSLMISVHALPTGGYLLWLNPARDDVWPFFEITNEGTIRGERQLIDNDRRISDARFVCAARIDGILKALRERGEKPNALAPLGSWLLKLGRP